MSGPVWRMPRGALWVLQLVVGAGLVALVWRAADGPEAARRLVATDWRWLVPALLALTLQVILSALRWRLTARQLGIRLGTGQAIREYYLSQLVNQSLPGGMVGDATRAVRSRDQAGLVAAGQAVVFERLAGQIALFVLCAGAFVTTLAMPGGLDWPPRVALAVGILLAGVIGVGLILPRLRHLPGAAGRMAEGLHHALHLSLVSRSVLPCQIMLSIGTTLCILAAFAFCARAVDVGLGFAAVAALVPLVLFTMLIPVSISGWGLREGAAAALLPIAGVTVSGAIAASVVFGLMAIVTILPGAALLWISPTTKPPAPEPAD